MIPGGVWELSDQYGHVTGLHGNAILEVLSRSRSWGRSRSRSWLLSIDSALEERGPLGLKNSSVWRDRIAIQGIGCGLFIVAELGICSLLCQLNSSGLSQRRQKAASWCPIERHWRWLILWTVGVWSAIVWPCAYSFLWRTHTVKMPIDSGMSLCWWISEYNCMKYCVGELKWSGTEVTVRDCSEVTLKLCVCVLKWSVVKLFCW